MASISVNNPHSIRVEKLNHPDDYYIYFDGGYIVWNFLHDGTLYVQSDANDLFVRLSKPEDIPTLVQAVREEPITEIHRAGRDSMELNLQETVAMLNSLQPHTERRRTYD